MPQVNLKQFQPSQVPLDSRVVILGPSGSGKSNFLRSFLFERRNEIETAVVFSGSEAANGQWQAIFPKPFVYNKFDVEVIQMIMKRQKVLTNSPPPGVNVSQMHNSAA